MRRIAALLLLSGIAAFARGQWVETTIPLPDSASGLAEVGSLVFHSPNNTIYIGGEEDVLIAVDARTNTKLTRVAVGFGPHLLCSVAPGNKVYCSNLYGANAVTVIDGATNQPVRMFPLECTPTDLCYNEQEDKLYCGSSSDSFVRVVDCEADSVVARIPVGAEANALCYNPQLNRLYCAHSTRDEVTVIDCAADTVVSTIWVRGSEPVAICYDPGVNCVYTANAVSSTASVIDCAGDTLLRLVGVGRTPQDIVAGAPGKVYCANYGDSSVTVISGDGVRTVRACRYPRTLSYDPLNAKVYCSSGASVTVMDAVQDTVLAEVGTGSGRQSATLCCNPAGSNTYAACVSSDVVSVVGGMSDSIEARLTFGLSRPGPLCYSPTSNHLYCLDSEKNRLFVIDGDSSRVLKTLKTGSRPETLIWSPARNKVYIANWSDGTVSILDCVYDSIVATVATGRPRALCCSDSGKVYVGNDAGGVAVIDGGDSVRSVISVGSDCTSLGYDRTDNKVYVGMFNGPVHAIDADGDSLVATILVPGAKGEVVVCWNQNHDKAYVSSPYCDTVLVVDCAGDSAIGEIRVANGIRGMYSDSACDKVYCVDDRGYVRIIAAATDTYYRTMNIGYMAAQLDNGKYGPANRLYLTVDDGTVAVLAGYKTDSILRRITVGKDPYALAWNPTHSRIYVANTGSSSITVIRDTLSPGVAETPMAEARATNAWPTVVRSVLFLPSSLFFRHSSLLSASGRKVLDLHAGANDVSGLSPGVYFVMEAQAQAQAQAVRKIVITR